MPQRDVQRFLHNSRTALSNLLVIASHMRLHAFRVIEDRVTLVAMDNTRGPAQCGILRVLHGHNCSIVRLASIRNHFVELTLRIICNTNLRHCACLFVAVQERVVSPFHSTCTSLWVGVNSPDVLHERICIREGLVAHLAFNLSTVRVYLVVH